MGITGQLVLAIGVGLAASSVLPSSPTARDHVSLIELREVTADLFRETFTQYDVEVDEREKLPKELRRGLLGERGK